ncbi:SEL1-like repeat protein [Desulfobacterales bacterium HSG17]|nr:SEL1-like repeat protein [Desulfobacterales bacterium HSG17]
MKTIIIITISILFSCVLVFADEYGDTLNKAEQGYAIAQYELGIMYKKGVGFPQNYKQAYIWFSLAAAQGHKDAEKKRNLIERKLTPQQLGYAQDLAVIIQKHITALDTTSKIDQKSTKPVPDKKSINGKFITTSNLGTLFIVTGNVINHTSNIISHVKIQCILNAKGKAETTSQTVYCGNVIAEDVLKNSTMLEITSQLMFKNGQSNRNLDVEPDETIPFMIVFSELPAGLQSYEVEVTEFEKDK